MSATTDALIDSWLAPAPARKGKPEIGYSLSTDSRARVVYVCTLGGTADAQLDRVMAGLALACHADMGIERAAEQRGAFRVYDRTRYPGRGGGALRESIASDRQELRRIVREAIKLAGFKAVKL